MEAEKIIRNIIKECVCNIIENVQMADKEYFNSGRLSQRVKDIIVSKITGGDNYTKIITDIYWAFLQQSIKTGKWALSVIDGGEYDFPENDEEVGNDILQIEELKQIKQLYQDLKTYNKNVFPIKELNIYKASNIWGIISGLKQRRQILELFKKSPSIAWRNMKSDIRKERDYPELQEYRSHLEYFSGHYSLLGNRNEELQKKVTQKMFKSEINLKQLIDFAEEK